MLSPHQSPRRPKPILPRGQDSQDTLEEAAARQRQTDIRRENRFRRRHGEEPSPTPSLGTLMRPPPSRPSSQTGSASPAGTPSPALSRRSSQNSLDLNLRSMNLRRGSWSSPLSQSPVSISPLRRYFLCENCQVIRPNSKKSYMLSTKCGYCSGDIEAEVEDREVWCTRGNHELPRRRFGGEVSRLPVCDACRNAQRTPLQSPRSSPQLDALDSQPSRLRDPDPRLNLLDDTFTLSPALSERDWASIKEFHEEVDRSIMEVCDRCKERWFDMVLREGVCKRCRTARDKRLVGDGEPFLMSAENEMDPGDVPSGLPSLTQVEEMLIARVHVFLEVRQIRGQQYRYKGNVVNFLRDVSRVFDELPLLPRHLDIVLLRPSNTDTNPHMSRQFIRDFVVRQQAVRQWLYFLRRHHPGYRDIVVNEELLSQLPIEDNVLDQIITMVGDAVPEDIQDDTPDDGDGLDADGVAVPNVNPDNSDLEDLRQQLAHRQGAHITLPPFRATPLSEFNREQALLSRAFPTLYPYGKAEWISPRCRTVAYKAYIEHLIKYRDGRFAQHPRFRYVVFNTMMRQQSNIRSTFFVRRHPNEAQLDVEELRQAFTSDSPAAQSLLNSVVRYSGSLRGTRPFWNGKRYHLEACVRALGPPQLYLTFSAADLQWDDLQQRMPNYDEWANGTTADRVRISRKNLTANPQVAAYHFHRRFVAFMAKVICPKFQVKDYWNRYEWQGRGSTHNHGFVWCKGETPAILDTVESLEEFARFWGVLVTAINPQPGYQVGPDERSPIALPFTEQENSFLHLSSIINRVQRHKCTEQYCLTRKKPVEPTVQENSEQPSNPAAEQPANPPAQQPSEKVCRFYFPHELRTVPAVTRRLNPKHLVFVPTRNDDRLNAYNRLVTMAWLANTDVSPCTSSQAVLNYIGKYCTKAETKTTSYADLVRQVVPTVNSNRPLLSLVAKVMNKLIGERDWSAQEISHLLLNLPLQSSTRTVLTVDCRPEEQQNTAITVTVDGEVESGGKSPLQKYKERDMRLYESLTYFTFLTTYEFTGNTIKKRPRAKARVLNYWPRYKMATQPEDYCRVKMMLHHSFVDVSALLEDQNTAGITYTTWAESYRSCKEYCAPHLDDYMDELEEAVDDNEFEELEFEEEDDEASWELLAQETARQRATRVEDPDHLGERDNDRAYWSLHAAEHVGKYDISDKYWEEAKTAEPAQFNIQEFSQSTLDGLQAKQRQLFNVVTAHYEEVLRGDEPGQLLLHLDGRAGTGKTHVIMLLSSRLQQLAHRNGRANPLVRSAPTGVAAHGISGRTLHSLFRLPIKASSWRELSAQARSALQADLRHCKYLIIDEKSMIGLRTLGWIDERCRQAFPQQNSLPFSGLNIILCGDFYQLTPVLEKPLYSTKHPRRLVEYEIKGRAAYELFNRTIELDTIMRQQGPDQQPFLHALSGLRNNDLTVEGWRTLTTRVKSLLPIMEVDTFNDALHIYAKKDEVNQLNHEKLRDLGSPVLILKASHEGSGADKVSTEDGGNLHKHIAVALGARVMLTENVWTERGLVNGSLGTVFDVAWRQGVNPSTTPPFAVLIEFDCYNGLSVACGARGKPVVPILQSNRDFIIGSTSCRRIQFPLTIAYAITIHKSQGVTVDKAVLSLKSKDFALGLSYVAVSRVRSLDGLLFEESFDYERFQTAEGETAAARRADYAQRRRQHL